MNIQDLEWLRALGRCCQRYGIPLILDEVFTGMGRLGAMFAYQRAGLQPDVVCIAKGLTGGTLPLAVTLTRESVFENFLSDDRSKALLHGHTFTGNAIACSAALATLDVYADEKLIERVGEIESSLAEWLEGKADAFGLRNPRSLGVMMAFELPGTGAGDYFHPLAHMVPVVARRHGLLMRTLGNTLYLVPPLSIHPKELNDTLRRIERTLTDLQDLP